MTSTATKDSSGNVADAWSYTYDSDSVYTLAKAGYPDGTSEAFTYDP
jgi:hypothetical protein